MKRFLLTLFVLALYALHQDVWLWRAARPLLFGFLPPGITYHVGYTLAVAALMWLLVKFAWPRHLEEEPDRPVAPSPRRPVADYKEPRP